MACLVSACAANPRPSIPDRVLTLNAHALRLHFANAPAAADGIGQPLIVFATGDGGMHRKDLATYRHLVAWGYPIVAFDAHDYVTHLGRSTEATTPGRLASDYGRIIDAARQTLGMDRAHPVVLVGVSRGAGLSVVAAGAGALRGEVAGVVAVALTQEEEYVQWYRRLAHEGAPRRVIVDVYEYLSRLEDLPLAVNQSTRDNYLPAAAARALFGPDTAQRRLVSVDARNHSFGGARDRMYDALRSALRWIAGPSALGPDTHQAKN